MSCINHCCQQNMPLKGSQCLGRVPTQPHSQLSLIPSSASFSALPLYWLCYPQNGFNSIWFNLRMVLLLNSCWMFFSKLAIRRLPSSFTSLVCHVSTDLIYLWCNSNHLEYKNYDILTPQSNSLIFVTHWHMEQGTRVQFLVG